jgi:hypothetical protein
MRLWPCAVLVIDPMMNDGAQATDVPAPRFKPF